MKKITIVALGVCAAVAILIIVSNSFFRNHSSDVGSSALVSKEFSSRSTSTDIPSKRNVNEAFALQVERLRLAVEKPPDNVFHLTMLARLLMDGHKAGDAIPYFEQAVRVQPKNDSLLLDLSVCYSIAKNYAAALSTTDRLLQHNAANLTALYNKGALLATLGKTADAGRVWKKILTIAPESNEAQKAKAGLTAIGR